MEATQNEVVSILEQAKAYGRQGMYGKAAILIMNTMQKSNKGNIYFSLADEIVEALLCKGIIDDCGKTCGEMGVGGCCCSVALLVLAGWGCACICPQCECCGECSSEFIDTCVCRTGKMMWDAFCCCNC